VLLFEYYVRVVNIGYKLVYVKNLKLEPWRNSR